MTKFIYGPHITGESTNLTYATLPHNEEGKQWLKEVDAYTNRRFDLWGGRDEKGEDLRCFFTFPKIDPSKPIGYVNIGVNNFSIKTIEFGIHFKDNISPELVSEAAKTILVDYIKDAQGHEKLTEYKKVFGTLSTTDPLAESLKTQGELEDNGFKILTQLADLVAAFSGENPFAARFTAGENGEIIEGGAAKYAFVLDLESTDLAGNTAELSISEV